MACAMPVHAGAHFGEFLGPRRRRMRRAVFVDALGRQFRAIGPGAVEQVHVGAQLNAGGLQRAAHRLRRGQAQHLTIDDHGAAGRHCRGQPVDVLR